LKPENTTAASGGGCECGNVN